MRVELLLDARQLDAPLDTLPEAQEGLSHGLVRRIGGEHGLMPQHIADLETDSEPRWQAALCGFRCYRECTGWVLLEELCDLLRDHDPSLEQAQPLGASRPRHTHRPLPISTPVFAHDLQVS